MAVNQKAVKVLNKILDAGFTEEKAIAAITMDDILSMQGITVADITLINDLQRRHSFRRQKTYPNAARGSAANETRKASGRGGQQK